MISYKKNTIVAYRIPSNPRPLYAHPECADRDFLGEGEAIVVADLEVRDMTLYFPGEYSNEWSDRSIDLTCCAGCGQWFNDDNHFDGVEGVVKAAKQSRRTTPTI